MLCVNVPLPFLTTLEIKGKKSSKRNLHISFYLNDNHLLCLAMKKKIVSISLTFLFGKSVRNVLLSTWNDDNLNRQYIPDITVSGLLKSRGHRGSAACGWMHIAEHSDANMPSICDQE